MGRLALILVAFTVGCASASRPIATANKQPRPTLTLTTFGQKHVVLARPQTVHLIGRLSGDDLSDFSCAAIEWQGIEGASLNQPFMNCEGIQVVFFRSVNLHRYQTYRPRLLIRSPIDGRVLVWDEVTIEVMRPED